MGKQVSEILESLLGFNKLTTADDGSGFTLKTTFEEENQKDASAFFAENYSFNNLSGQKLDKIAATKESNADKKKRLEDKSSIKEQWGGMKKKTNLSVEEKNQLVLLKLKEYLNPKQHFRTNDMKNIPKFFQIGTYIEGGDNGFAASKITRGQRKSNLANEILEIDRQVQFTKRKFGELQTKTQRIAKNSIQQKKFNRAKKHMKHLKKHKK